MYYAYNNAFIFKFIQFGKIVIEKRHLRARKYFCNFCTNSDNTQMCLIPRFMNLAPLSHQIIPKVLFHCAIKKIQIIYDAKLLSDIAIYIEN